MTLLTFVNSDFFGGQIDTGGDEESNRETKEKMTDVR